MPGYMPDYSRSVNAADAEARGLFPASVVAKRLRVPVAVVRAAGSDEWHHVSSWYRRIEYYDEARVREWLETPEGQEALAAARAATVESRVIPAARVTWLEWSGSRRHPRATEYSAAPCRVELRGQTAYVTLPDGKSFRKRITTHGFQVEEL